MLTFWAIFRDSLTSSCYASCRDCVGGRGGGGSNETVKQVLLHTDSSKFLLFGLIFLFIDNFRLISTVAELTS